MLKSGNILDKAKEQEQERQKKEEEESGEKLQNENEPDVSVKDVQKHTLSRLIKDYYKLALIFGSLGARTIVNYMGKVILQTDNIENEDQVELIKKLKGTLAKLSSVAKDEKVKEAFNNAMKSLGSIFAIFLEHSRGPMFTLGGEIAAFNLHILMLMYEQMISTIDDSIKLVPILGDGYMIVSNLMSFTSSATNAISTTMQLTDDLYETFADIKTKVIGDQDFNKEKDNYMEHLVELKKMLSEAWKKSIEQADDFAKDATKQYAETKENETEIEKPNQN